MGFTAAALLPLALGIGTTSAIFSVVYAVMMRPLPYEHPETIVRVWETRPRMPMSHRPGAGGLATFELVAESAVPYRPRHPEQTLFYQLFDKHFDDYVYAYEAGFENKSGPLRPVRWSLF